MATAAGCAVCHTAWNNVMINNCPNCDKLVCGKCWRSSQCMGCLNSRQELSNKCDSCKKSFFLSLNQKKSIKIFVCKGCENICCDDCLWQCMTCRREECSKCHTNASHLECADCEKKRRLPRSILDRVKELLMASPSNA